VLLLTDEQVAEGLKRAREIQKREHRMSQDSEYREFCACLPYPHGRSWPCRDDLDSRLALALQERLEAAEAVRDKFAHASDAQAVAWKERALKAEAERDEARQERDASVLHARGLCRQLDETQEERDTYERLHASARQQARREAFEEAAKEADNLVRLLRKGAWPGARYSHDDGADDVEEFADAIRALAEVER
jgi:hypothetical protein